MDPENFPKGTTFIEIREIYDGWSIAQLPSGELVNRWPENTRRHAETQECIEKLQKRKKK